MALSVRRKRLLDVRTLTTHFPARLLPQWRAQWRVKPRKSKVLGPSWSRALSAIADPRGTVWSLEGDHFRLLWMQREPVLGESLRQDIEHALRVAFVGEHHDGVIRVADERCLASQPRANISLEPHVEDIVEENVRQYRRDNSPLRGPRGVPESGSVTVPFSMTPAFNHFAIRRSNTPSRTRWRRTPCKTGRSTLSKNFRMSSSTALACPSLRSDRAPKCAGTSGQVRADSAPKLNGIRRQPQSVSERGGGQPS